MNYLLAALLSIAVVPFGLNNGNFKQSAGDKAVGWDPVKHYKVLPDGGRNGNPAIELECKGQDDSSGAMQALKFSPARRGAFKVSAWVKGEGIGQGGDFALWLDVMQDGGKPIWGRQGVPDRQKSGWQYVTAEVTPDKPVSEIQIWLLLRNCKGKAWFSDVRIEDLPLKINDFRVFPDAGGSYEVRASFNDNVAWRAAAAWKGKEIWQKRGEGRHLSERFETLSSEPVQVTINADRDGVPASASLSVKPRKKTDSVYWWTTDSMTRVFQDDLPPEKVVKKVTIDAARNDRESFQICLRPAGQSLKNIKVQVSDLAATDDSMRSISKSAFDWYRVGYVWVKHPYAHPFSPRDTESWWPDPLLPAGEFSVESRTVQPLWFTLYVPRDASPGEYSGTVTISADGMKPFKVPLTVNVYPSQIPEQGYMKTAFALMDCYMNRIYGSISPKLQRAYTDYLLAHHMNPDDISRSQLPDLRELEYADTHGLNAFNILNVVEEPKDDKTWTCWSPVKAYTPEFKERFFKKLDSFIPELEKRGLIDKAYIYGFDERGPEFIPVIRDLFGEIKKRYPKIHTLSTCWPPADTDPLSLNIDWYVPLSSSYNQQMAEKVRTNGGEMWWYVCLGPNYPYANWLLENPLIEARLIWWQAFQNDVEGFLYWGLNIWEREHNDKPIKAADGPRIDWSVTTGGDYTWLNGDGVLLYPGENGPIGSIRMENIRDGLEDIELLRQYKEKHGQKAMEKILERVSTDRTRYSRNHNDLLSARKKVLNGK